MQENNIPLPKSKETEESVVSEDRLNSTELLPKSEEVNKSISDISNSVESGQKSKEIQNQR